MDGAVPPPVDQVDDDGNGGCKEAVSYTHLSRLSDAAIILLFFLYGAKLSRRSVWAVSYTHLGIPKGPLAPGAVADITVIDPQLEEKVEPQSFVSKGRNTPFAGRMLKGLPVFTMVEGKTLYSRLF